LPAQLPIIDPYVVSFAKQLKILNKNDQSYFYLKVLTAAYTLLRSFIHSNLCQKIDVRFVIIINIIILTS